MINDNYLNGLAQLMTGESYNITSHLAFGSTTGTLTATDVVTSGEFDRNPLDNSLTSGMVAKFIGSRSSTEAGNERINLISFVNSDVASGTGDIQANMLVASLLHTSAFSVEAEMWITHVRV